jgi:predicted Zn-ribbon and HTH transcriptional regulator
MLNALYGPHLPSMSAPASTDAALVPASSAALIQELRTLRETLLAALADQQTTADKVTNLDVRLTMVEDVVEDLRQIAKISAAQAEYIQRAIKRLAARYQQRTRSERNMYERLFAEFKIAMGIPRYDALPAKQYDRALAWLSQQAATYLPDDPDALPPHQEQLV